MCGRSSDRLTRRIHYVDSALMHSAACDVLERGGEITHDRDSFHAIGTKFIWP